MLMMRLLSAFSVTIYYFTVPQEATIMASSPREPLKARSANARWVMALLCFASHRAKMLQIRARLLVQVN